MSLREALAGARERLRVSGSDEAEIEAEVLLRHALSLGRATFLRLLNEPISDNEALAYEGALTRRLAGEPTAYITGTREFHGLDFKVTPATLIPRPETEMLVDLTIERCSTATPHPAANPPAAHPEALEGWAPASTIVDVGTGSGAIAVSLAKALPAALIYATDISPEALTVARENGRLHGVDSRIVFHHGDLLESLAIKVDVIVANLPYVTEADWQQLPREIREHEPRLALASGADGLDVIRALLRQAPRYLNAGGSVLLEFGIGQAEEIQVIARQHFPEARIDIRRDFADIPRALIVQA